MEVYLFMSLLTVEMHNHWQIQIKIVLLIAIVYMEDAHIVAQVYAVKEVSFIKIVTDRLVVEEIHVVKLKISLI